MRNRHTPRFEPVKILLPCYLSAPISNANILWGGAATALLGATLAEWQRKRAEEEAARLAALRNSGGGDEGEAHCDPCRQNRMRKRHKRITCLFECESFWS